MKNKKVDKMTEFKEIDNYFPKGDKRRGEALVVNAEAFLLGKQEANQDFIKTLEDLKNNFKNFNYEGYYIPKRKKLELVGLIDKAISKIKKEEDLK